MSAPENPPAFPLDPRLSPDFSDTRYFGMTLRDWFAGQVLASAAALPHGAGDYLHRAKVAYEQADVMLTAREGAAS